MTNEGYEPVEDGWYNSVKPVYVALEDDYFFHETLNLVLSFRIREGAEQPKAKIPVIYAHDHEIAEWENGEKKTHVATEQDQRDTIAFLGRLFPEWAKYCEDLNISAADKIGWLDGAGMDIIKNTPMDIKVRHSMSGFCSATVKDPAKSSKRPAERTLKSAALTRANAAFSKVFGSKMAADAPTEAETKAAEADDGLDW